MYIKEIIIKNFRKLQDVKIEVSDKSTIIVGKNNTGKTSLVEIINKFFNSEKFTFEDFSVATIHDIKENVTKLKGTDEYHNYNVPAIELKMIIAYNEEDDLTYLSNLIADLDENNKTICILFKYEVDKTKLEKIDFKDLNNSKFKLDFINCYCVQIYKINPTNESEVYKIERQWLEGVLKIDFLYAQRKVDDTAKDKDKNISKVFEGIFSLKNKQPDEKIQEIEALLTNFAIELDEAYPSIFEEIFHTIKQFGIKDKLPNLELKSLFNTDSILKHNTRLYYNHEQIGGHLLPESYNGLGFSNLLYIILQIFYFQEDIKERPHLHHLILIEEPEAHLHPQMQQVFIRHIKELIKNSHQILISTHSSHIASEGDFADIRYFCEQDKGKIEVKNLNNYNTSIEDKSDKVNNERFLKQYMHQQRCDMFFADKIILIEGVTERLVLPKMIEKLDKEVSENRLSSQYICIIEVGGAYAHIFKSIIDFLGIKTLIITDLDSCDPNDEGKKCNPSLDNAITSNQCLKDFVGKDRIADILSIKNEDKICEHKRIAYQIAENITENVQVGRSFEEQFYYSNTTIIDKDNQLKKFFTDGKFKGKKADFAFAIMFSEGEWKIPKYIKEGLLWLANDE